MERQKPTVSLLAQDPARVPTSPQTRILLSLACKSFVTRLLPTAHLIATQLSPALSAATQILPILEQTGWLLAILWPEPLPATVCPVPLCLPLESLVTSYERPSRTFPSPVLPGGPTSSPSALFPTVVSFYWQARCTFLCILFLSGFQLNI